MNVHLNPVADIRGVQGVQWTH